MTLIDFFMIYSKNRVILEKLIDQFLNKSPAFYGTRKAITMFTPDRQ
jgi:hypothetical protein